MIQWSFFLKWSWLKICGRKLRVWVTYGKLRHGMGQTGWSSHMNGIHQLIESIDSNFFGDDLKPFIGKCPTFWPQNRDALPKSLFLWKSHLSMAYFNGEKTQSADKKLWCLVELLVCRRYSVIGSMFKDPFGLAISKIRRKTKRQTGLSSGNQTWQRKIHYL